jgi:hypothetical protein
MSNAIASLRPQPYGLGGRKVNLPVTASQQIYEGTMLSQPSGALVPATTGGDTHGVIGVAEHDALGGGSDGLVRCSVWTDKEFIFTTDGSNGATDATPYGTILYAVDDHTVGTSSVGSSLPVAGRFVGIEDDGRTRIYIGWMGCASGTP